MASTTTSTLCSRGVDVCSGGGIAGAFPAANNKLGPSGAAFGTAPICTSGAFNNGVFVNGSEVQRWGLGVVQEIDSAAMHLFARWQHQDVDVDLVGFDVAGSASAPAVARPTRASRASISSNSVA